MRVAMVGLGAWATKILGALPPETAVVAVVTRRANAERLLPDRCAVVQDVRDAIAHRPDGIIVANEASRHVATVRAIRECAPDIPLFVEKPLGMSLAEVEELAADAAGQWNGAMLVDHVQLFNANLARVMEALGVEAPGEIVGSDANHGPFRSDCSGLWDYGPHAVAVAIYLCGIVPGEAPVVRDARESAGTHGSTVEFELQLGACRARLTVGNGAAQKSRQYSVRGSRGRHLTFDGLATAEPPPLSAALRAFADAVAAGEAPLGDLRWGWSLPLAVTQTLDSVERLLVSRRASA